MTPKGQRSQEPFKDEKARATIRTDPGKNHYVPKRARSEPAELIYDSFCKAKQGLNANNPKQPPMKNWNQLSVYDRAAWRVLMREMATAAGKIPVSVPESDEVMLTLSEHGAYVSSPCAIDEIKSPSAKRLLTEMRKELTRINNERRAAGENLTPAEQEQERKEQEDVRHL
jgi:hypothetical protein